MRLTVSRIRIDMNTISKDIKILALSYYDGATEGFIDGMWDSNIYFFKVVAWDQNQDERLYLLGKVERDILPRIPTW